MKFLHFRKKADNVASFPIILFVSVAAVALITFGTYNVVMSETRDTINRGECEGVILKSSQFIEANRGPELRSLIKDSCFRDEIIEVSSQENFIYELNHCKEIASYLVSDGRYLDYKISSCIPCVKLVITDEVAISEFHFRENNRGDEGLEFIGNKMILVEDEEITLFMNFIDGKVTFSKIKPTDTCTI